MRPRVIDVLLGVPLAVAVGVALHATGKSWYRATNITVDQEDVRWAALGLAAVGVLLVAPSVWGRISPLTTATAAVLLAAAVVPGLFQRSLAPESLRDHLLPIMSRPTTYVAIGVLVAVSLRPRALVARMRARHTGLAQRARLGAR